jgi:hypothetical protein
LDVLRRQEGESTAHLRSGIIDGAFSVRVEGTYPSGPSGQLIVYDLAWTIDNSQPVFFYEFSGGEHQPLGRPSDITFHKGYRFLTAAFSTAFAFKGFLKRFQKLDTAHNIFTDPWSLVRFYRKISVWITDHLPSHRYIMKISENKTCRFPEAFGVMEKRLKHRVYLISSFFLLLIFSTFLGKVTINSPSSILAAASELSTSAGSGIRR